MKRGLKVQGVDACQVCAVVTTVSPMKRGLKGIVESSQCDEKGTDLSVRYNRFPDEKGTESRARRYLTTVSPMKRGLKELEAVVTTVSPMKRGLKDFLCLQAYNRFPDEKGTES